MRDSIQSRGYFLKVLEYQHSRILKFENFYKLLSEQKSDNVNGVLQNIALFEKDLFTAMYSMGEPKEKIEKEVQKYLQIIERCGKLSYADAIDILALAILFEYDYEEMEPLIQIMENKDDLIYYLISVIKKEEFIPRTDNLLFKDKYVAFVKFIRENDDKEFKVFMEKQWYDLNKDMYWYDSHKSQYNIYMGYWCWLSAALYKVKYSSMKETDIMYVPGDLI